MNVGPTHYALLAFGAAIIAASLLLEWLLRSVDQPSEALGQKLSFRRYEPKTTSTDGSDSDGGDGGSD